MEQYIPKSALLAEIEKLVDKGKYHEEFDCAYRDGNNSALYALKEKIDTLEVKEVDLEKIIEQTYYDRSVTDTADMDYVTYENIAKHFFKLGLKVTKGII